MFVGKMGGRGGFLGGVKMSWNGMGWRWGIYIPNGVGAACLHHNTPFPFPPKRGHVTSYVLCFLSFEKNGPK